VSRTEPEEPVVTIDARGHRCPTPTLRLRRALEAAGPGELVRLLADDPMARIDVPHFCTAAGHVLIGTEEDPRGLAFTIRKSSSA
jgi:tRNA 2-thiouridine synthesizing protein A